jgi:PTH1 family peptidyl-tRNA hydrolase
MKAIVGLGNPGPRYQQTRHNAGWMVVDRLAARWPCGRAEKTGNAEVRRCTVDGETVLLVKPLTYMNESGRAIRPLIERDRLRPEEILVIYDDMDLALGRIRVRPQGSSGGHGGIKSIQEHLAQLSRRTSAGSAAPETDGAGPRAAAPAPAFPRIKVGIGRPPPGMDPIDFVLAGFTPEELAIVGPALALAADAAECWLREGIEVAMNRFNGLVVAPAAAGDRQAAATPHTPGAGTR